MNTVKAVIFIACIIGVITSMTDIATPEGTLKKQLRSVLAVIFLLAVITPVMGHGFKVTLSDYTELADLPEFDSVSTATKLYYLSESESRLEEYFLDKLNKNGIENVRVDITTDINEYNDVNTEVITSKLIMELLTYVLTVNKETNDCDSALNKKLSAVYDYINRNFNSDISLDELSSQFYISKFYLTREFKKLYGKTIFQQIITARINYGKELLRFTDKTVEEIAHLCGFNDQSYFARQFKKIENLTCFSYRKMWRD